MCRHQNPTIKLKNTFVLGLLLLKLLVIMYKNYNVTLKPLWTNYVSSIYSARLIWKRKKKSPDVRCYGWIAVCLILPTYSTFLKRPKKVWICQVRNTECESNSIKCKRKKKPATLFYFIIGYFCTKVGLIVHKRDFSCYKNISNPGRHWS